VPAGWVRFVISLIAGVPVKLGAIKLILKTSVQATKTKKPLTTETQRHREKHENKLFLKDFLCASVVSQGFIAPDSPIG
jgi:hypothetical protein